MTNLDSILKSRGSTLPTKVCLVKAMVFPVVMYGCESWTIKKAGRWSIEAFKLWCWAVFLPGKSHGQRSLAGYSPSVQFSRSVVSDSLQSHRLQHTRLPSPTPTPRVYSNSCPSSPWCHPTISSLVVPFSSCLQSFPASGSFPMSQFFASGGQSIGVSTSASVLPMNIQDWFPLGLTGLWRSSIQSAKKDWELTVAQIMNLLPNSDLNWRK